ncbi:hypothetical protein [Agromyces italicus]|uniref:hypothetical protein n=1 Tax=Agromyces italicus TaxID=279572 RepID=UPI0012F7AE5F|nr:hypothetical protein [Agromyces italicus]
MLTILVAGATTAVASEPVLTEDEVVQVREFFTQWDVPVATQDVLLDGLQEGELWDAYTGATPVRVVTESTAALNRTVTRYADGSVSVNEVEVPTLIPDGAILPRAISGCTQQTNAGVKYATNCRVYHTTGATSAEFYASYSIWSTGASVSNWGKARVLYDLGNVVNARFEQTSAGEIKYKWDSQSLAGTYARNLRLTATPSGVTSGGSY